MGQGYQKHKVEHSEIVVTDCYYCREKEESGKSARKYLIGFEPGYANRKAKGRIRAARKAAVNGPN